MSDVLVLCYHALSPTWPAALSIDPAAFERQLQGLARRGYRGATLRQAIEDPPAARTVAVTFDDAYVSVLELAQPILDRLGWPASTRSLPASTAGTPARGRATTSTHTA